MMQTGLNWSELLERSGPAFTSSPPDAIREGVARLAAALERQAG